VARSGLVREELPPPFRLAWVRHFEGERLGSAAEPVVQGGKVFVATHQGNLYALDGGSGRPCGATTPGGAFLHSPAFRDGLVLAAEAGGGLHAVQAETGRSCWAFFATSGGFAASPTIGAETVFIGTRAGEFLGVELQTGKVCWRLALPAPVRQTAAYQGGRVFFTAEDLRVRCLDAGTGKVVWVSQALNGQTARDGYPVVVQARRRPFVVVRTNPVVNMARRIAEDRRLLGRTAGVEDRDWKKLDAWTKSDQTQGTPRCGPTSRRPSPATWGNRSNSGRWLPGPPFKTCAIREERIGLEVSLTK
jgi:outer membrane protein assembly factor BamB